MTLDPSQLCGLDANGNLQSPPTATFCRDLVRYPTSQNLSDLPSLVKLTRLVTSWRASALVQSLKYTPWAFGHSTESYDPHTEERFFRAVFRLLFAGFLFGRCGLHLDSSHFQKKGQDDDAGNRRRRLTWRKLVEKDARLYDGFIDWLVMDGESRGVAERMDQFEVDGKEFSGAQHGGIRELLLLHTMSKFLDSLYGHRKMRTGP
jgi:hypothetical protein